MIFHLLGKLVRWAWPLLLAAWALLALGTWYAAPPWSEVAQDKEFDFLPPDSPSRQAEEVFQQAFPDDRASSTIVLVLHRTDNQPGHLDRDRKFIEDTLEPRLRKLAEAEGGLASEPAPSDEPLFGDDKPAPAKPTERSIIARIRTPNAPGSGTLLVSPNQRVLLVVLELTTPFVAHRNWQTLDQIEDLLRGLRQQGKVPQGLEIFVTGSAAIGRDHSIAQLQSARATERLTVGLVIVLLILIYRAPLLAIIPLATVYLAVRLALNVLAILADYGYLTLFQGIEIYITILSYGAGVDYCLFLTARYKEELDRGANPADAVAGAVGGVGAALAASAATVICGIGMMMFAEFGKFREAGYAIPLSLLLVLCATLTFSPSLLRLAGRWAFWPQRFRRLPALAPTPEGSESEMAPRGALQRIWDWMGQLLLRRAGTVWLVTAAVMVPFVVVAVLFYGRLSYDLIGDLPSDAPSVAGTQVLQENFPGGVIGPVTVLLIDPRIDFRSAEGKEIVAKLTARLREERKQLGLADIRSLAAPLGITEAAAHPFDLPDIPEEARREAAGQAALQRYVSALGERTRIGTRLELILQASPFAHESMQALDRIEKAVREALPEKVRQEGKLYFAGSTASVSDLARVMQRDRLRIELLVLVSVFVVLLLLLRRLVVTIYLLLSVLFSYYATLGAAFAVFGLLDPHFAGIDWKVAIFLFTILIAVGEDYNIFLMTRVDEESQRFGPVRGITAALDRTGPIISSCGIIMAGTFASLLAGSLTEMKQLGFALAFGVLLDTFVVRPILVPAFLILLRGGRLPLGRRRRKERGGQEETARSHSSISSR
jgi:RND superfamily putative drug exporter